MLELFALPEFWAGLVSLAAIEIVLAVDNVLFISIAASQLPEAQRRRARILGLGVGMFMRIALLFAVSWVASLTEPVFTVFNFSASWRDIILVGGGLFLIWKSTDEIFKEVEQHQARARKQHASFWRVISQIMILDIVFSLDSVITAVGVAEHVETMVIAIIIAVLVMMIFAEGLSAFVERHPSAKMLAISILAMVGMALVADGLHYHIDREYLYAAMLFATCVEALNLIRQKRRAGKG